MAAEHQHYVPQLLLRGFLSQIGNEGQKEQVRVFDLERQESFPTSISNIMGERRFNEWWLDEETLASIEPSTGQIESQLAPLIEKIRVEKQLDINPDTISNLALLMAFQFIRTKKMRMLPERLNEQILAQIKKMGLDPAKVDGLVDWDKESLKKQHVKQLIDGLEGYTKIMFDKAFFVMTAPKGKSFYIGDHPVTLHNDEERRGVLNGLGIGVPYIQIYLPLSHDVTLCAYDYAVLGDLMKRREKVMNEGAATAFQALTDGRITRERMKEIMEASKEFDDIGPLIDKIRAGGPVECQPGHVDAYNALQVTQAHRFVVDPSGKFDIVDEIIARREKLEKAKPV